MMPFTKIKIPDDPLSSNIFAGLILAGFTAVAGGAYSLLFEQLSRFNIAALCSSLLLFLAGAIVLLLTSKAHSRPLGEALLTIATIVLCSIALVYLLDSKVTLPNPQLPSSDGKNDSQHPATPLAAASAPLSSPAKSEAGLVLVLFFPSGAILFALLWQAGASTSSREKAKQVRKNVGFAATGVLAVQSTDGGGNFLLVLNKNLRNGQGLWVPPGGHVDIFSGRPEDRVLEKTLLETGFDAKIVEVHTSMLPPMRGRETDLCTWYTPPAFFLREDLQGSCSQFHEIHLDFVYILISTNQQTGRAIKYGQSDRILIPIRDCYASHDVAKTAIAKAIDAWRTNQGLNPAAMLDNCTADVAMRLHLAAQHLVQVGIIK